MILFRFRHRVDFEAALSVIKYCRLIIVDGACLAGRTQFLVHLLCLISRLSPTLTVETIRDDFFTFLELSLNLVKMEFVWAVLLKWLFIATLFFAAAALF